MRFFGSATWHPDWTVRNPPKAHHRLSLRSTLHLNAVTHEHPATLSKTVKIFWRDFAPVWAFPVIFLDGSLASEKLGYPILFFWLVALPLFFWSGNRASRPYFQKKTRYWHVVFWGVLVPFVVWVSAVISRFYFVRLLGGA